jgi:hypothetical protein
VTDSDPKKPKLGDVLIAAGVVNQSEVERGLAEQSRLGTPLGMTLVRLGLLDEATLIRALASQLKLPVVSLRGKRINSEILQLLPISAAEKYRCLPLLLNGDGPQQVLYLGFEDPTDAAALEEVKAIVGMAVQPVLVSPTELDECIYRHYHWESSGKTPVDSALQSGPLPIRKPAVESAEPRSLAGPTDLFSSAEELSEDQPSGFEFVDSDTGLEEGFELDADFEIEFEPAFETESQAELSMPESLTESMTELLPEPDSEFEIPEILEFAEPPPELTPVKPTVATSDDSMLRAVAQLLIEKQIFTRDELVDRLRTIAKEDH